MSLSQPRSLPCHCPAIAFKPGAADLWHPQTACTPDVALIAARSAAGPRVLHSMLTASGTLLQVEDRTPSLRMRHLAEAASPPPNESSPTWVLPNLDPTQVITSHAAGPVHDLPEIVSCSVSVSTLSLCISGLASCRHMTCARVTCRCLGLAAEGARCKACAY